MAGKVTTQLVIDGKNKAGAAFKEAEGQLGGLSSSAKKAAGILAGVFSVTALAAWVKESALATAEMSRMARLSGATAEAFQGWAHAAKTVGIEQDKLGDIFKDVQDKVGDFLQTGGGPMADFFENIAPQVGVTAEQFRSLSGPDALGLYVSSLEKANLSQAEMTFYMEAIANDASLLLPLLKNNAAGFKALSKEAEELGLIVNGRTAEEAEQFNKSLLTLGAVSDGAGKQIAAELLPTLNSMTGLMTEAAKEGGYAADVANVLGFGLKVLASGAIIAGNAFGSLGRFISGTAAAAAAAATGEFRQAADIMRMVGEDNARETGAALDRVRKLWDGTYEGVGASAGRVHKQIRTANEGMADSTKVTAKQMQDAYKNLAKEAKARISEITKAEQEATRDVERLRQARLDIEQRYSEAMARFSGGTSGASFAQAQALKAGARNALQNGDLQGAQEQAKAALKVLEDLADAGENTYGFRGFANELQAIEQEANRLEQTEADKKLAALTEELDNLKKKADIEIKVDLSPAELEAAKKRMQELAEILGQSMVITPTVAVPQYDFSKPYTLVDPGPPPPKFATGGHVRGPGTGTSDSIPAYLSNGEYVLRAAAVRRLGSSYLDMLNNGMHVPRFADGGLVSAAMSAPAAPDFPHLGRLDINAGGQTIPAYIDMDFAKKLSRTALKIGRTHK